MVNITIVNSEFSQFHCSNVGIHRFVLNGSCVYQYQFQTNFQETLLSNEVRKKILTHVEHRLKRRFRKRFYIIILQKLKSMERKKVDEIGTEDGVTEDQVL